MDEHNKKANIYLQLTKVFQEVWDIIFKKLDLLSSHQTSNSLYISWYRGDAMNY